MPSRFRPLPYDEALAQRVLDRIAAGQMLRELWRDPALPTRGDLRRWRHADPKFAQRLRQAVNAARGRRMTTYDPAVADHILERLCEGESLRRICRNPALPTFVTVFDWLKAHPDFAHAYQIARQVQTEHLVDLSYELAMSITPATARIAAIQLRQLRWHTGKVSPKAYGPMKPVKREGTQGVTTVIVRR